MGLHDEAVGQFLSTPSARRATLPVDGIFGANTISIHALREEGDLRCAGPAEFQQDFYPRPPRGGRPQAPALQCAAASISIPALREEGDVQMLVIGFRRVDFYPRPPRGGRRIFVSAVPIALLFLSPPSARRATKAARVLQAERRISIPALREEGDLPIFPENPVRRISIPALREEGDTFPGWCSSPPGNFYPRPPRGGRPAVDARSVHPAGISIPALREEGDWQILVTVGVPSDFYPRPPRGGRRRCFAKAYSARLFLSPPSARRATWQAGSAQVQLRYFYPRPPRGGRPLAEFRARVERTEFLSPPSARRATRMPSKSIAMA